jgi:hypothetical protein
VYLLPKTKQQKQKMGHVIDQWVSFLDTIKGHKKNKIKSKVYWGIMGLKVVYFLGNSRQNWYVDRLFLSDCLLQGISVPTMSINDVCWDIKAEHMLTGDILLQKKDAMS